MYRALSQQMTCRDKASYDSTPPCSSELAFENVYIRDNPHEKLLGITWVSNPATNKDLAARTRSVFWYESKIPVLFEIMVKIKQKRGTGVKNSSPKIFWCGLQLGSSCGLFAGLKLVGLSPANCPAKSPAKKNCRAKIQTWTLEFIPACFGDFCPATL